MTLLEDIIEHAVDNKTPLSVLLRKCLVLSADLKNDNLKNWVSKELNGYAEEDVLPEYRVIPVHSKGHFLGPFGASIQNQPLPSGILEEQHRELATKCYLREPAAAYDHFTQKGEIEGELRSAWSPDLVFYYQEKFLRDYHLAQAWREIPLASMVALVDTIRNRILSFALEIKDALDVVDGNPVAVPKDTVNQHVTNIIYGGTNVISGTAGHISQLAAVNVQNGDMNALALALHSIGLDQSRIEELRAAIKHDGETTECGKIGPQSASWLTTSLANIGKAGLKVGTDVATSVITRALMGYYGLS